MLKKILEEIRFDRVNINTPPGGDADKIIRMCYKRCENIIRKHMDDGKDNDGWIPVEAGLPDELGYYLATVEDNGQPFVDCRWLKYRDEWTCQDGEAVTAWRPLPKPYSAGNDKDPGVVD